MKHIKNILKHPVAAPIILGAIYQIFSINVLHKFIGCGCHDSIGVNALSIIVHLIIFVYSVYTLVTSTKGLEVKKRKINILVGTFVQAYIVLISFSMGQCL